MHVNYRVANLPALQDSVKSSFVIKNAEGSTFEGFPVNITPSRDELQVIALNTKSGLGDVNGDGCIDILDLIMVVDHIVGRDSLNAAEFARADIAPWATWQCTTKSRWICKRSGSVIDSEHNTYRILPGWNTSCTLQLCNTA